MLIAIVGAESTGKTELARSLVSRLTELTGLRCTHAPEAVRLFCEREGRVPRQDEQAAVMAEQIALIEAAAAAHDIVICDTTPLMTAIYSEFLFADRSLIDAALAFQRRCVITLLTALDIEWQADEGIRDGAHVREPVDGLIRRALLQGALRWSVVSGAGPRRVESALDALTPLFKSAPKTGLFTRLDERQAALPEWRRFCDCDDPACEHALFQGYLADEKIR